MVSVTGDAVSVGVAAMAVVAAEADPPSVKAVAATSAKTGRTRLMRRGGRECVPAATRDRSQRDMVVFLSAAWRTPGVPWLCGPASRRVCLFVDNGHFGPPCHLDARRIDSRRRRGITRKYCRGAAKS